MLVSVFANPHTVPCLGLRAGHGATLVKTHRAGFPLVNLTRQHVYWSERLANVQLLRVAVPPSCSYRPIPRLLGYNDASTRLTFEFVPPAPANAIPDDDKGLALATCLHDFLLVARVTHGDLACKHLLWTRRAGAVQLMLIDFDMATFAHDDWNATARQASILARVKARLQQAQALLRQRKVEKGTPWFVEGGANTHARFAEFVRACAQRRRQGLDGPVTTKLLPCTG